MSTSRLVLVCLALSASVVVPPAAGKALCEEELLLAYGTENSQALIGRPTERRTLRAEPGSLAATYPDVLARVASLARRLEREEHRFGDYTLVWTQLQELALDQRDPRLGPLVASVAHRLSAIEDPDVLARATDLYFLERNARIEEAHRNLRRLADHLWEFAVATMVDGRILHLDKPVSFAFGRVGPQDPKLDVIAIDGAGHARWIEVKNAKVAWWQQTHYLEAIRAQARLTARARLQLPDLRITRELVFVEPYPYRDYKRVLRETGYDRMNSIFLDPESAAP